MIIVGDSAEGFAVNGGVGGVAGVANGSPVDGDGGGDVVVEDGDGGRKRGGRAGKDGAGGGGELEGESFRGFNGGIIDNGERDVGGGLAGGDGESAGSGDVVGTLDCGAVDGGIVDGDVGGGGAGEVDGNLDDGCAGVSFREGGIGDGNGWRGRGDDAVVVENGDGGGGGTDPGVFRIAQEDIEGFILFLGGIAEDGEGNVCGSFAGGEFDCAVDSFVVLGGGGAVGGSVGDRGTFFGGSGKCGGDREFFDAFIAFGDGNWSEGYSGDGFIVLNSNGDGFGSDGDAFGGFEKEFESLRAFVKVVVDDVKGDGCGCLAGGDGDGALGFGVVLADEGGDTFVLIGNGDGGGGGGALEGKRDCDVAGIFQKRGRCDLNGAH